MPPREIFARIVAEPSATIRKFKLMKAFGSILPPDVKTLSADQIADIIRSKLNH